MKLNDCLEIYSDMLTSTDNVKSIKIKKKNYTLLCTIYSDKVNNLYFIKRLLINKSLYKEGTQPNSVS